MEDSNIKQAMDRVGLMMVNRLKELVVSDNKVVSSSMLNSIRHEVVGNTIEIWAERYSLAISEGAKPSSKGVSRDFRSKIKEWMKGRGMMPITRTKSGRFRKVTEHSYNSAAYAIARSILRNGRMGNSFYERAYQSLSDKIGDELIIAFGEDIEIQFRKAFNTLQ